MHFKSIVWPIKPTKCLKCILLCIEKIKYFNKIERMVKMLNVSILMGRLTADPELKHTRNNVPVTTITLAVERNYKSRKEKSADFIDVICWRQTAEFVVKYFKKGQLVAVKGSIQTRSYTDNQGIKRKAFEINADNVYFAEGKRNSSTANEAALPDASAASVNSPADNSDFVEISNDDNLLF